MIVLCAWCGKQVLDSHDCNEKRAALGTTADPPEENADADANYPE